jgi:hypothetical protein
MSEETTPAESAQSFDTLAGAWTEAGKDLSALDGISMEAGRTRRASAPVAVDPGPDVEGILSDASTAIIGTVEIVAGLDPQPPELAERLARAWTPFFNEHPQYLEDVPLILAGIGTVSVGGALYKAITEKQNRDAAEDPNASPETVLGQAVESSMEDSFHK